MARPGVALAVLAFALVATNLWWAYQALDAGISYTHLKESYEDNKNALAQVLAITPALATCDASEEQIIAIAQSGADGSVPFEKEGLLWVGSIGLRFGPDGKLQAISRAWDPP